MLIPFGPGYRLFLSDVNLNRAAGKVEMLPQLVLEETFVRVLDVLRQVAEEGERRETGRELRHILDLDVFTLPCRRRAVLYFRKHRLVQHGGRNLSGIVPVHACHFVKHIENPLLVDYGGEDYWHVVKWRYTRAESIRVFLHRIAVLLEEVPFVHHYHAAFAVALYKVEDAHVLGFHSGGWG